MMSSPKSVSVKNAVFKQKMRINHVKYGQIVQIYHFARFTSVFSFLLPFVNKNLSLMVKLNFSSKSVSVKTTVFKHKLQIYHSECCKFSNTMCTFTMKHMMLDFHFFSLVIFCQQKPITHGKTKFLLKISFSQNYSIQT